LEIFRIDGSKKGKTNLIDIWFARCFYKSKLTRGKFPKVKITQLSKQVSLLKVLLIAFCDSVI